MIMLSPALTPPSCTPAYPVTFRPRMLRAPSHRHRPRARPSARRGNRCQIRARGTLGLDDSRWHGGGLGLRRSILDLDLILVVVLCGSGGGAVWVWWWSGSRRAALAMPLPLPTLAILVPLCV